MKRLMLVCVMALCVFLVTACASISRNVIIPTSASFDIETDGLVQVQTVHESDKTVKNYVLASGIRIMDQAPVRAGPDHADPVERGHHIAAGLGDRTLEGLQVQLADRLLVGPGGDAVAAFLLVIEGKMLHEDVHALVPDFRREDGPFRL